MSRNGWIQTDSENWWKSYGFPLRGHVEYRHAGDCYFWEFDNGDGDASPCAIIACDPAATAIDAQGDCDAAAAAYLKENKSEA